MDGPQVGESAVKVVAIGGGTGLSTLLKGLKHYIAEAPDEERQRYPAPGGVRIDELTAVVTVTDDGGSSGRLRDEFGILPPGDIRNCIVALSEDEALLSRLFQYRFTVGAGLEGHNFGNLFLTALNQITGDFAEAVRLSSEILATRGRIYPSTTHNVQLVALMDDGSSVRGETRITASKRRIVQLRMAPADAKPLPQTLQAIEEADLITIGPGSLYTSLVPNLLVNGIPQAIARARGLRVYVCNLMTQANESLGLSAAEHIQALHRHARTEIFDYALVNSAPVSQPLLAKYEEEGAEQIEADSEAIAALGVKPVLGNYLEEAGVARHATSLVARELLELLSRVRSEQPRENPANARGMSR